MQCGGLAKRNRIHSQNHPGIGVEGIHEFDVHVLKSPKLTRASSIRSSSVIATDGSPSASLIAALVAQGMTDMGTRISISNTTFPMSSPAAISSSLGFNSG